MMLKFNQKSLDNQLPEYHRRPHIEEEEKVQDNQNTIAIRIEEEDEDGEIVHQVVDTDMIMLEPNREMKFSHSPLQKSVFQAPYDFALS